MSTCRRSPVSICQIREGLVISINAVISSFRMKSGHFHHVPWHFISGPFVCLIVYHQQGFFFFFEGFEKCIKQDMHEEKKSLRKKIKFI